MKVRCKIKAFYNGEIIKPGTILEIKENKAPSWAKVIESKKTQNVPQNDTKPDEQNQSQGEQITIIGEQNQGDDEQTETDGEQTEGNGEQKPETEKEKIDPQFAQELSGKTESELTAILDDLLTQALDKGILIDTENKTLIEQINELTIKLSEENK